MREGSASVSGGRGVGFEGNGLGGYGVSGDVGVLVLCRAAALLCLGVSPCFNEEM